MVKSNSVTGVITPVKTPALKRIGQSISVTARRECLCWRSQLSRAYTLPLFRLQRSISFRTEARPLPPAHLRQRPKASSFPRRRNSKCWSDTVESHDLTVKEIKRQEVKNPAFETLVRIHLAVVSGLVGHPAGCAMRCEQDAVTFAFSFGKQHQNYERGCELAQAPLLLLQCVKAVRVLLNM